MRTIIAFLALLTVAAYGQTPLPKTIPFADAAGKQIGTATFSGNRIYLRDSAGVLIGTIVDDRGHRTMYDPNGHQVDVLPFMPPG